MTMNRRDAIKTGLSAATLAAVADFDWILPALAQGEVMVPFTESRTGAVKHSPSGMLRSPVQALVGMFFLLKRKSVPGPVMRTWSVRSISSTSGFVYVYDLGSLKPAGRIKIGTNVQLETATTDTADEKLYLAESTNHEIVIIDARTHAIERVKNVGLFPWGTHIMDSKDNYCH